MRSILFTLVSICAFLDSSAQNVIRGPYMQTQTSDGIIIKWRTDVSTSTKVWYGDSPFNLTSEAVINNNVNDHTLALTGLNPYTKYYYAVGNMNGILAGADSSHYFITAPLPYTEQNIRVWATGDFGKGNQCQIDTKVSFQDYTQAQNIDPDIWLWLGDNAYDDGKDNEYQSKVFDLPGYSDIFSWMPFFPSPGNHDYNSIWSSNGVLGIPYTLTSISDHNGAYYDIVDVPEYAEAGGFPSTHEVFYSYDYGNTHFLSLNSEVFAVGSDNVLDQMKEWIDDDLAQNDKDWTIAYWHQPPYSKGSHDSDDFYELVMAMMREEVVPLLESYDIDMIICGHSHVYERSYLIHGHYGLSNSLLPSMILDNSNGNRAQGNAYVKDPSSPNPQGTVYAVVGNAGSSHDTIFGNHPVMASSYTGSGNCGSLILDIYKNELRGRHLTINGALVDDFSIVKQNMSISIGNDTIICENDTITLEANITKGSDSLIYTWMPGNLSGSSIQVSPSTNTTYTLQIEDLISGQIETATKLVEVSQLPANVVIEESNGVLSVPSGFSYTWYRNGQQIPASSATYTPSLQGTYEVLLSNSQGCQLPSDEFYFYDLAINIIADKTSICEGDSVILFLSVNGGSDTIDIDWVNITAPLNSFYYTPTASETIIAEGNDYLTGEYERDTLEITVNTPPVGLQLSINNGNIICFDDPNWSYKWYVNNTTILGQTESSITPTQDGTYVAEVTDENGCKALSDGLNYTTTGINTGEQKVDLLIIPNPNSGSFTIKTNEEILRLSVYDYQGKLVYEEVSNTEAVSLQNLAFGAYILEVETSEKIYNKVFYVE
jgi:hypothetical protein